jgi:hypothetical protein
MPFAIRPIFSDAALEMLETDWSITAVDPETAITVTHQDVFHDSELTFHGGIMGNDIVRVYCRADRINTIATLIIDGIKAQVPKPS